MVNPAVSKRTAPPVSVVQDWRVAYDGSRGEMIDMSQAVPGYTAHPDMTHALERAAADTEAARYGRVEGDWDLRRAYAAHLGTVYGCDVAPETVHITSGCNQAFVAAALAVAGHGDEILMTRPCYFNHESALGMLGIGIGYVDCHADNAMLPRLDDIDILNYPT